MIRKEALKILKECCDKGFNRTTYTYDEYVTARDMAIEALEQEPKQVELEGDGYADGQKVRKKNDQKRNKNKFN